MIKKIVFIVFVVCAFLIAINAFAGPPQDEDPLEYFVQRAGNRLMLNGQPYYFNTANNDHLYHWSHFMIDDVLEDAKGLGLTAFRTWASSEGQNSWKDGFCFQPDPGVYDEPTFRQMDYIIAKAKEKGIRLILPLINNWDDGFGGMPQYVRWSLGDVKDWSSKTILTFDLYNAGDAKVADVAIRTGPQWTWHESTLTNLNPGWNHNISYDLTAGNWKTEASGWEYTSPIGNLNQVQTLSIGVFEYTHPGAVYIDNIRFDSVLFDGLEEKDNWYETDYSYSTSVQISSDYVSEGSHSLKMTYSYSAGEYNKAFAEKQPQVDKNDFYTNATCKQLYKDYINYFLNRVNTITGKAYKDDPTILMWELANEPRCESGPSGDTLQSWIDEMAGYIKSIDPNHLVSTGEEGWYNIAGNSNWKYDGSQGTDYIRNNQSPYIDVCSFHLYPEGYGMSDQDNLDWIQKHLADAHNIAGKPVYLGEFGITADRKAAILYDFDADSQGWSIDWNYTSPGPIQVESPSRNGNGAISYTANIDAVNTSCGGRIVYPEPGIDYSGYDYFSGWIYIPASAPTDLTAEMYVHTGPDWNWASGRNVSVVPGTWTQVKLQKSQIEGWGGDITKVRSLGIQIKRANTDYIGEVYYDVIGVNVKDIYDGSYQMSRRNQLYGDWYNLLDAQNADGAGFWQLFAHRDDGSLFPDYWNWGVYYPEDAETSAIIQLFSALMKNKSGNAPAPALSLDINPASVKAGEHFTLAITCESSVPLDSLWWSVASSGNPLTYIPGTVDGVACNLTQDQTLDAAKGMLNYNRTMSVNIDNPGEYVIKANARDILYPALGDAHQTSQAAGISVVTVNAAPEFAPMASSYTVNRGETLSFIVTATDANGDQLSLKSLNQIAASKFKVGRTIILPDKTSMIQGRFSWTPTHKQIGTYTVRFRARDSKGAETDSIPVQIIVNKINYPP